MNCRQREASELEGSLRERLDAAHRALTTVVQENSLKEAQGCLAVLIQLLTAIHLHPSVSRYRVVRSTTPKIARNIMAPKGEVFTWTHFQPCAASLTHRRVGFAGLFPPRRWV